ncbi:MAG: single-stranded DNA-binding protein [Treponema sp.]|nr:single-stranded DNA-binding protein [Treponema sp.]
MNNLNSILIEGNLVRDPLFRSTPKGTPVCTFCLASNRFFKQDSGLEKEVSFFDVETWAKLAEHCYNLGHKGRGVRVVGRLKQERWTGSDGKSRSRITIVAEHVEFRPEFKKEPAAEKTEDTTTEDMTMETALTADDPVEYFSADDASIANSPLPVEEPEPVTF